MNYQFATEAYRLAHFLQTQFCAALAGKAAALGSKCIDCFGDGQLGKYFRSASKIGRSPLARCARVRPS
jgi:hypothetical protein